MYFIYSYTKPFFVYHVNTLNIVILGMSWNRELNSPSLGYYLCYQSQLYTTIWIIVMG